MQNTLVPQTYNVALTTANTEYSLHLPAGCRHFTVQLRTAADFRLAFETGKVATPTAPYYTVKSGHVFRAPEELFTGTGRIILFMANAAGSVVAEVVAWVYEPENTTSTSTTTSTTTTTPE